VYHPNNRRLFNCVSLSSMTIQLVLNVSMYTENTIVSTSSSSFNVSKRCFRRRITQSERTCQELNKNNYFSVSHRTQKTQLCQQIPLAQVYVRGYFDGYDYKVTELAKYQCKFFIQNLQYIILKHAVHKYDVSC